MMKQSEITLNEIAKCEGLHPQYLQKLSREKGFPEFVRKVGPTRLFDWRQINKYFRDREAVKLARKRK